MGVWAVGHAGVPCFGDLMHPACRGEREKICDDDCNPFFICPMLLIGRTCGVLGRKSGGQDGSKTCSCVLYDVLLSPQYLQEVGSSRCVAEVVPGGVIPLC